MSWGIIRYFPQTGAFPEDDESSFDGWYSDKDMAEGVYNDWCKRFHNGIVALVKMDKATFYGEPTSPRGAENSLP